MRNAPLDVLLDGPEETLGGCVWRTLVSFALIQYCQGVPDFPTVLRLGRKFYRKRAWPQSTRGAAPAGAKPEAWALALEAMRETTAEGALERLDRAAALDPRSADVLVLRALVELGRLLPTVIARFPEFLENSKKAEADLIRALELAPRSHWARLVYGILEYVKRRFHACVPHFAAAVDLKPRWSWGRTLLGDAIYYLRQNDLALKELEEAIRLDPTNVWAYALLGRAKNQTRDPSMIQDLDRAIALDPTAGWLWAWRGIAKQVVTRDGSALADFDKARTLDDDYDRIYAWRAARLIDEGRPAEAAKDLEHALKLNPEFDISHYTLGRAYLRLGRVAEGVEEIRKAMNLSYLHIWIFNWGDWNHQNHARWETLEDLGEVVKLRPKAAWAWAWRGQTRLVLKDHEGALSDLTRAVALDGSFAYAHAWRGEVLRRLNRPKEARASLERALALDPQCLWGWAWRGRLRLDLGDLSGADKDLTRAIAGNRRSGWAYVWRAEARLRRGDAPAAREDLVASLEFYPTWKWLRLWLAKLETRGGRSAKALEQLDHLVRNAPMAESRALRALARKAAGDKSGARADARAAAAQEPGSAFYALLSAVVDGRAPERETRAFLQKPRRALEAGLRSGRAWEAAADFAALGEDSSAEPARWVRYERLEASSPEARAAARAMRSLEPERALALLDKRLAKAPRDAAAALLKADVLLKLGEPRPDEAEAICARLLEKNPGERDARLLRHAARLALGDREGAVEDLSRVPRTQDFGVSLALGRLQLRLGRPDAAAKEAERLLELDPFDLGASLLHADARLAQGDAAAARHGLMRLLQLSPGLTAPRAALARLELMEGSPAKALAEADLALKGPAAYSGAARGWRALALRALGREDAARAELERALSLSPRTGWLRLAAGDVDECLRLDPGFSAAALFRGRGARAALGSALARLGEAYVGRGRQLLERERWREAARAFECALDADPAQPYGYIGRSVARGKLGDLDGQRADLRRGRELAPKLFATLETS